MSVFSVGVLILIRWASLVTQFGFEGLQDAVGVAEHAGGRGADLDEVLPHRLTQEHGVERRHLIHSHRSDFKHLCNLHQNMHSNHYFSALKRTRAPRGLASDKHSNCRNVICLSCLVVPGQEIAIGSSICPSILKKLWIFNPPFSIKSICTEIWLLQWYYWTRSGPIKLFLF